MSSSGTRMSSYRLSVPLTSARCRVRRSCSQSNSNFAQTEDLNVCSFPRLPPGLRQLSVSELTETLEEVETAIRRYSEELIQALALRDELDYEKEVLGAALEGFILKFWGLCRDLKRRSISRVSDKTPFALTHQQGSHLR